jgi:transcriptional antiterminator NusG
MEEMGYPDQEENTLNSAEVPEASESELAGTPELESVDDESTKSEMATAAEEEVTPASEESTDPETSEVELTDLEQETSIVEPEKSVPADISDGAEAEEGMGDSEPVAALEEQGESEATELPGEGAVEEEVPEEESEIKDDALVEPDPGVSLDDKESSESDVIEIKQEQEVLETETSVAESDLTDVSLDFLETGQADMIEGEEDGRSWFVVHCYSGYENKVRHNLEQRIETMGMKDKIFDIVVPTEEEIEVREGKRRTVERRVFPGYILVNMVMTEESWYVVRNTPGVTGFVGMGNTPTPLRPEEVSQIIKRMEAEAPRIKVTFKSGERVRIVDGPFNDFRGTVSEIDMERAKVRVMVNFFGRETPVELDFLQVEKT